LFHILVDHLQAASQLATEVQRLGGRPANGTQAWDRRSHLRIDAAKLFGDVNLFEYKDDKGAIEALKEGEESGLKEYQAILHDQALSPEVKPLIRSLKTKQQARIRALDDLMMSVDHRGVCHDRHARYPASDRASDRVAIPPHVQKGGRLQVVAQAGPNREFDR